ncbi:MAG: hypothetical protein HF973_07810 [Chloroflexi bacterium]|nr:hypothetical protein [Chloroflexota bacterium]
MNNHAFVTFLMQNDSYLPGALLQAYGLRRQKVRADLLCMVTAEITPAARQALGLLFDRVIEVEKIYVPHKRVGKRPYIPYVFTKLHALRLGADGDLSGPYDKAAILDADLLPIKRYDSLFRLPTPAGTINERKSNVMEWGVDGNFIIPDSVAQDGTWKWHRIYADCLHGRPIPKTITDRVAADPTNMGIIGSLLLIEPSLAEYEAIRADLSRPSVQQLVGDAFDWPEMQYLTMRWSGQWTNIDLRYHSLNGYPDLAVLYGIHYTGFKPWQFRKEGSMKRYGRRADFQYWFNAYRQMTDAIPDLLASKKLRRLRQQIDEFQGIRPQKRPKRPR